ncbi:MAG: hypothetical protein R2867_25385 [Caldilineaceae bacterium]
MGAGFATSAGNPGRARRTPFHLGRILAAFREVFVNRIALGYTIMAGLVSGGFVGYLNSAQQIFQEEYGLGARFPFYFAAGAGAGHRLLSQCPLGHAVWHAHIEPVGAFLLSALSLLFLFVALARGGNPTLWLLMSYFMVAFFAVGILFGNLNARAMVPLGHIAGVGAAVVGALSTLISALLGALIGQSYNGTVLPLVGGFALFGLLALGVMWWAERGQLAVEEA